MENVDASPRGDEQTGTEPGPLRAQPGDAAEFRKTMTEAEQALYTGISGNMHPLYVNRLHARATEVGERLVFELAVSGLATTALAALGGPWMRLGEIALDFPDAARVGDTVTARAEVTSASPTELCCRLLCTRQDGVVVGRGTATLVAVRRLEGA